MKKVAILLICIFLFTSCASSMTIKGHKYRPYGFFNRHERYEYIDYEVCWGNVIWSVILFQTVLFPVMILGFGLMEPVGYKECVYENQGSN